MEAELFVVLSDQVAERAAGPAVEVVDPHLRVPGTEPPDQRVGVGVGAKHLVSASVELAGDPDQGDVAGDRDLGLGGVSLRHLALLSRRSAWVKTAYWFIGDAGAVSSSSGIAARRSSSLRYRSSACRR